MYKDSCASNSLIHFPLFLRWNNHLLHLYFNLNSWPLFSSTVFIFKIMIYLFIYLILSYVLSIGKVMTIDSSSLNIFSSLLPYLAQIIKRNISILFFFKIYDISGFLNFRNLLHLIPKIFFNLTFRKSID